jgi:phosphoribosylglycinamide formyltransferase (EC 2.1.2.2)
MRAPWPKGVKLHGCTVHFVTTELDRGPIIAQAAVQVETRIRRRP